MRRGHWRYALPFALVFLSACTSLRGTPEPIIAASDTVAIAKRYPVDQVIDNYEAAENTARENLSKRQYRDKVIVIYMNAMDARYGEFRAALSSEGRGAGLGFDLAVLGLTTGASVAKKAIVNELSAVAAAFSGARIAVDKNLYFEKALPALLAAMDAARTRVKTRIYENLQRSEADYPLQIAIGQVSQLELAASLDQAVDAVVTSASTEKASAQKALNEVLAACDTPEDLVDRNDRIGAFVQALTDAGKQADLVEMDKLTGGDGSGSIQALNNRITGTVLTKYCSNKKLDELIGKVAATAWGSTI